MYYVLCMYKLDLTTIMYIYNVINFRKIIDICLFKKEIYKEN